MKVLAINGSARKNGNTAILVNRVFQELENEGIETELIQVGGNAIRGCTGCRKCAELKNNKCIIDNDMINEIAEKMIDADGIILASPTYFSDVTAEMKAIIDRTGMIMRANGGLLKRKVGASVVAVRRGGSGHAFNTMNHFFFISEVIVPGSNYWNFGFGKAAGDVNEDTEGLETMAILGQNMAWTLKKINA